jgi:membrane protease YdiL (CAAX protease family)
MRTSERTPATPDDRKPVDEAFAARPSGFRGFAARRPIAAMLVMLFSIAYPLLIVLALVQHQVIPGRGLVDALPVPVDEVAGLALTVCALLPSALYVTWAAEGRAGLRRLAGRVFRWRFGLGWWVFILTALPVLTLVSGLLLGDTFRPVDPVTFLRSQLWQLLVQVFLVNLWEETAWAGVMQTRLERRHHLFVAAIITAVPFGFVHWPLVLLGDVTPLALAVSLPGFILLGVLMRPLAAMTMRGARNSVFAFALVHSMFNRTNNPGGIVDSLLDGDNLYQVGILVVLVVLNLVVAVIMRGKLSPSYRRQLETLPDRASGEHDEARS